MKIDYSIEADGRWIAEVEEVPGAMAHGVDGTSAKALALNIAADVLLRERDEARSIANAARKVADKHLATIAELRATVESLATSLKVRDPMNVTVIAARALLERTEP